MTSVAKLISIGFIGYCLTACSAIDQRANQGLYKYAVSHCSTQTIDTVYATVAIKGNDFADSVMMTTDLAGYLIGTKDALLAIWAVDSIKENVRSDQYILYSRKLKTGDRWLLHQQLSFSKPRMLTSFRCISSDTSIATTAKRYKDLTLVEKREHLDVGDIEKVTVYGFSTDGKIVIKRVYSDTQKGGTGVVDCYELSLVDFEPVMNYSDPIYEEWVAKNSRYVNDVILGMYFDSLAGAVPQAPKMQN